jgi:lysophospholipase L1-like esterase
MTLGLAARRLAVAALLPVLIPTAAFTLLEGASSLVLFAWGLGAGEDALPLARLRHTRFDPELGWAHLPGVRIDDLYGPGVWLQTNGQGFRADRDFSQHVPPGRLRVVCSGDSFTLGYGVANDQTWCARLEALEPRFETVNMGQGGYGIDQAWLWYRRDGMRLDHQVHVFAFIFDDFRRMQASDFIGYGKPVLGLRDDHLVVLNTPVPRRPFYADGLEQLQRAAKKLRASQLARRLRGGAQEPRGAAPTRAADEATSAVLRKLLDELLAANRAKGSQLVLVYLPTPADWNGAHSDGSRRFMKREARERGIPFLDLVVELRRLPAHEAERLFIRPGVLEYRAAAGHLTPKGNAWVAERLHATLAAQPSITARLGAGAGGAAGIAW